MSPPRPRSRPGTPDPGARPPLGQVVHPTTRPPGVPAAASRLPAGGLAHAALAPDEDPLEAALLDDVAERGLQRLHVGRIFELVRLYPPPGRPRRHLGTGSRDPAGRTTPRSGGGGARSRFLLRAEPCIYFPLSLAFIRYLESAWLYRPALEFRLVRLVDVVPSGLPPPASRLGTVQDTPRR